MKFGIKSQSFRGGFVLLEVILALAIFGLVSVGITRALQQIGEVAIRSGEELRIQRKLESWLTRYSKADFTDQDFKAALPIDEIAGDVFGETPDELDEMGVNFHAFVSEDLEMITLRDDQEIPLQSMYKIRIEATWGQFGQERLRSAETLRYESLYQNR